MHLRADKVRWIDKINSHIKLHVQCKSWVSRLFSVKIISVDILVHVLPDILMRLQVYLYSNYCCEHLLLYVRPCAKHFDAFYLIVTTGSRGRCELSSLYGWGNWGTERWRALSDITQILRGKGWAWIQATPTSEPEILNMRHVFSVCR